MARTHQPPLWQPAVRSSRKRKLVNYLDEDSDFDLGKPASRPVRQSRRIHTYNEDTNSDNAENDSNDSSAIENTQSFRQHSPPSTITPGRKVAVVVSRRKGRPRQTTHNTLFSDSKRRKPN